MQFNWSSLFVAFFLLAGTCRADDSSTTSPDISRTNPSPLNSGKRSLRLASTQIGPNQVELLESVEKKLGAMTAAGPNQVKLLESAEKELEAMTAVGPDQVKLLESAEKELEAMTAVGPNQVKLLESVEKEPEAMTDYEIKIKKLEKKDPHFRMAFEEHEKATQARVKAFGSDPMSWNIPKMLSQDIHSHDVWMYLGLDKIQMSKIEEDREKFDAFCHFERVEDDRIFALHQAGKPYYVERNFGPVELEVKLHIWVMRKRPYGYVVDMLYLDRRSIGAFRGRWTYPFLLEFERLQDEYMARVALRTSNKGRDSKSHVDLHTSTKEHGD